LGHSSSADDSEASTPLGPDGVVRACLSEIWRYRLAIQIQIRRIKDASDSVLVERERIERDKRELLFRPSADEESFDQRLEEVHSRDVPLIGTVKTEGQFLLSAVCSVLSNVEGYSEHNGRRDERVRSTSYQHLRTGRARC
jgi:hypothetical protein